MTRRTQEMYIAVLSMILSRASEIFSIDLAPSLVVTDFELASINAFKDVFPDIVIKCCHFHLSQAVIRKVNELGLKKTFNDDVDFSLHIRMLLALAYLPTDDVPAALEIVRSSMPAIGIPILQYFDSTYVTGMAPRVTGYNANRRRALFPPSLWNVSERFLSDLPTTTNHVEAWHHRLQPLIVINHPALYTCLHKIKQEQRRTEVQIL